MFKSLIVEVLCSNSLFLGLQVAIAETLVKAVREDCVNVDLGLFFLDFFNIDGTSAWNECPAVLESHITTVVSVHSAAPLVGLEINSLVQADAESVGS